MYICYSCDLCFIYGKITQELSLLVAWQNKSSFLFSDMKFMERRCLTENECLNLTRKGDKAPKWKLMAGNSTAQEPNRCLDECPTGYTANEQGTHCIRCNRSCPKGMLQQMCLLLHHSS